ncbi:hypothetical protein SAMN05444392_104204 [Seinonella peptonophila]|uniref:Uncharacterized protein n=1 Tax=Seinonella peptonophila TaxID=112248 RepID=A0A1M4X929_9BACL|nr:hypothetical protein SAMN05444392_104204 [Seinonella peptonophila]
MDGAGLWLYGRTARRLLADTRDGSSLLGRDIVVKEVDVGAAVAVLLILALVVLDPLAGPLIDTDLDVVGVLLIGTTGCSERHGDSDCRTHCDQPCVMTILLPGGLLPLLPLHISPIRVDLAPGPFGLDFT